MLQNNPGGDVAPAYLASLPTTAAVLTALRSANAAKLNMLAGAAPVEHESVDLVQLLGQGEVPRYCREVCFSPNGLYMSVVLGTLSPGFEGHGHRYSGVWDPYTSPPPTEQYRKGLLMLSLEQGIETVWPLSDFCRDPVIRWSPDSRLLSVVILLARPQPMEGTPAEAFNVMVFDVQGNVVYRLGDENRGYLWYYLCKECFAEFEWSSSGQYLLVISHRDMSPQDTGCLTVVDVWGDQVVDQLSLLAQSDISVGLLGDRMTPAAWHPTSHCIVVSYSVKLQDPESFAAAGVILGHLPDQHFIPVQGSARFSPDGQYLVADYQEKAVPGSGEELAEFHSMAYSCESSVLSCSFSGTDMLLEPIYSHSMQYSTWAPYSSLLLCTLREPDCSFILDFAQQPCQSGARAHHTKVVLEGKSHGFDACFSISAQLVVSSSGDIYSSGTGKVLRAKSDHYSEEDTGQVDQFLPSGRGLVSVKHHLDNLDRRVTTGILHILTFA